MVELIRMPEVLAGSTEAAIQTWLVQPGAAVLVDQPLAEIETDKAIVELTAETDGVIGRLLVAEGDTVAVGDPIIMMLADGEDHSATDLRATGGVTGFGGRPDGFASPDAETVDPGVTSATRLFASPLVRKLAAERGISLEAIPGTGPRGRIVRRDLERYLEDHPALPVAPADREQEVAASPAGREGAAARLSTGHIAAAGAAYVDAPLDRMRTAIAKRVTESKSTVPHFYLVADCRVDELLELRRAVNESSTRRISLNDFVLKAVGAALVEVAGANVVWNGDSIRRFSSVDVAVAVATNEGLVTPVVRGIERTSLTEVSALVTDLAERARSGRLKQHELEGGSFALSNLGMYGTQSFSAILNPPHAGILAVGAARKAPVVNPAGELEAATLMTVTLSADHRVLDGAIAAEWLAAFKRRIEAPLTILV